MYRTVKLEACDTDTVRRPKEVDQLSDYRQELYRQGSISASLDPHGKSCHQYIIQQSIQNAASNTDEHTYLRSSIHADEHSQCGSDHHQRIVKQHNPVILCEIKGETAICL